MKIYSNKNDTSINKVLDWFQMQLTSSSKTFMDCFILGLLGAIFNNIFFIQVNLFVIVLTYNICITAIVIKTICCNEKWFLVESKYKDEDIKKIKQISKQIKDGSLELTEQLEFALIELYDSLKINHNEEKQKDALNKIQNIVAQKKINCKYIN